ncbi:MAG: chemotaxis protein [Sulfurimonas denitrificans]|nr:chemotaxis protein [Sulfurimonas denitrificans]
MRDEEKVVFEYPNGYSEDTSHLWPLPATRENKMVSQLDEVTRESEEKFVEIFDLLDNVYNEFLEKEEKITKTLELFERNIALLERLSSKFPEVKAFALSLEKNRVAIREVDRVLETFRANNDSLLECMEIMQYQDINRQKIERVINVMRSLSNYMNNLLDGRVEDKSRVSSAQHITGDTHNELVSNDEIEALLSQFAS